jgi:benzoate/toluate 1,2-dioxygenase beta subunit
MPASQQAVEAFLLREARLLDEARYEEWLALFTDTATYWVPSQAGQKSPKDTVSLIYDDRRLLEARVRRLLSPNIHAQRPPSRTSRIVANVTIETATPDAVDARSKLLLVEYRRNRQRIYAGTCWHRLTGGESSLRIAAKRVDLIDCDGELDGLVVPL